LAHTCNAESSQVISVTLTDADGERYSEVI